MLSCMSSLYILDVNPLSSMWFPHIFSHSKDSLFILLIASFAVSVQFSHSVMSDSLRPHELQHTRPPHPIPTPRAHPNSCPRISYAIQPSHRLSSPSPPALNLSQHQGLFQWVSSLQQVAKVLEFQLQHQSFQWIFSTDLLYMDWLDPLAVQRTLIMSSQNLYVEALTFSVMGSGGGASGGWLDCEVGAHWWN